MKIKIRRMGQQIESIKEQIKLFFPQAKDIKVMVEKLNDHQYSTLITLSTSYKKRFVALKKAMTFSESINKSQQAILRQVKKEKSKWKRSWQKKWQNKNQQNYVYDEEFLINHY